MSAATIATIDAVAAAAREVRAVRAEALRNLKGGLRALYRTLDLPGANPLKNAHAALNAVGTTVSLHHFADAAVLAPRSGTGRGDSVTRADYSTGRAA